jgi:hypothetical protein
MRIDADHVYPVDEILKEFGDDFKRLPEDLQREVIYNRRNIQPLPPDLNQSKGARLAEDWESSVRAEGRRLDRSYVTELKQRQAEVREILRAQINCLLAGHSPEHCR